MFKREKNTTSKPLNPDNKLKAFLLSSCPQQKGDLKPV